MPDMAVKMAASTLMHPSTHYRVGGRFLFCDGRIICRQKTRHEGLVEGSRMGFHRVGKARQTRRNKQSIYSCWWRLRVEGMLFGQGE